MVVIERGFPTTGESVAGSSDVPVEQRRIPCEVYSRIVGYMTPVNLWNKGKQEEFTDRVVYEGVGVYDGNN